MLVTAAAGGTGHFGVQIAKLKGCRVIATCGSAEKAQRLRDLGVDKVINYRKEVSLSHPCLTLFSISRACTSPAHCQDYSPNMCLCAPRMWRQCSGRSFWAR